MKEAEKLLRLSISFRAKKSWAQTLAINKKKGIFKVEVREPATSLENWQTGIKSLLSQSLHLYIWRTGLNPNLYCLDLTQCKLKYHWFLFQIVISFSGLSQRENSFPKRKLCPGAIPLLLVEQFPVSSLRGCPDYMQGSTTLCESWQYLLTRYFVPPSHQVFFLRKELPSFQAFWPM